MKKHYFIIIFPIIALLIITGCSIGGQKASDQKTDISQQNQRQSHEQNAAQNQEQNTGNNERHGWNDNFSTSTISDLEIGGQVLVMGDENSDGSVSADRIIIGNEETDFQEMGQAMRSAISHDNSSQLPTDSEGQRPNFEQFQNMSEEERARFREEMMAGREAMGAAGMRNGDRNALRLNGEIINKDDISITLKLESGGSRLIFISSLTIILK